MIVLLSILIVEFATLLNAIPVDNSTNFAVSRLLFDQNHTISRNEQIRHCKCSEVKLCERLGRAEIEFCVQKCKSNLKNFGDFSKIRNCFEETQQELEIWSNCVQRGSKDFCYTSSENEPKFLNTTNGFVYSLNDSYHKFVSLGASIQVKKARRLYVQIRNYQHCFNQCAKRAEEQCLLSNGCRARYPPESELRNIVEQCDGLFPKALHSSVNTCDCLVQKHGFVRIMNLCEMVENRFLMTVL